MRIYATQAVYPHRVDTAQPRVVGKHVYGNLYGCNRELLTDEHALRRIVMESAKVGNFTILGIRSRKFKYGGVSVIAIVAESHISIHTWPEEEFASVDVYTCGLHTNPEKSFMYIAEKLNAKKIEVFYSDRSLV